MVKTRLQLALALARRAGRQALEARGKVRVHDKGEGDRVTEADVAVQSHLIDGIRSCFPGDAILAEEGVADAGTREFVWVIDPIDGTNNYALGIPCFAVSIGILKGGTPHAGVIHDPNTGFTCRALRGHGAVTDGNTLMLASRALTAASNVAVRVPLEPATAMAVISWLRRCKLRGFGSVALHLAYTAVGGLDLVIDHKAKLWDIAAGTLIVTEAGGVITDLCGQPLFPAADAAYRGAPISFVAGNRAAHAEALALLARHRADGAEPGVLPVTGELGGVR
jgi:myo-inositol-1(or 4)-monophosphatase